MFFVQRRLAVVAEVLSCVTIPNMVRPSTLLLLLLSATPLTGQSVRGRLSGTEPGSTAGAIVILLDSTGVEVARALSSPIGSYILTARSNGRYSLKVLRVGFAAWVSAPMSLESGHPVDLSLVLPDEPLVLAELNVESGNACRNTAEEGGAAATLLEEIGKAVGSAELALKDRELRFQVRKFARRTDLQNAVQQSDSAFTQINTWPVHSLSPLRLRDHGFIQTREQVDPELVEASGPQGLVWFGPDAATLFSAPFIGTHCFRARAVPNDTTRVRLVFTVIRGRRTPDIEGELWLDRRTLALEKLEFHYVNVPSGLPRQGPGGRMEFARLPNGIWLVSHWSLRAPIQRYRNNLPDGIAGWSEEGGDIIEIKGAQGAVVYSGHPQ